MLPSTHIDRPLGRWTIQWSQWEWFANHAQTIVWQVCHADGYVQGFDRCEGEQNLFRRSHSKASLSSFMLGEDFFQADVQGDDEELHLLNRCSTAMDWELDLDWKIPIMSLERHSCNQFRDVTKWAFQYGFSGPSDDRILAFIAGLTQDGIAAVSDGSSKDGEGSAAWICVFWDGVLSAGFKVPGDPADQDSYRSEMAGLHAILSVVRAAVRIFHLQTARVHIACDGESALKRAFYNSRPSGFRDSHWDLLSLLQHQIQGMP